MNQIQIQNIGIQGPNKPDIESNPKDTTIRKKNLSKKKVPIKSINIKKSNLEQPQPQPQQQIQQIQQIKRERKTVQKPTLIIQKKTSFPSRNTPNDNRNIIKNLWLNKLFIYCHESLNNYLNKNEFRSTLDKSKINYDKLIQVFIKNKQSNYIRNNIISPSLINRDINNKEFKPNDLQHTKKFIVTGGYCDVVSNLKARGWEQEKNAKNLEFDYIWTLKTNEINFMLLKNYQLCNHYFRNGQITRKSGLCKNIKNLYFHGISPMNFFPRCYDLSIKIELEDFKQDFKFTWAISLLKLFQKDEKENSRVSDKSKKFSNDVISTAVNIVERNSKYIENKGQYLKYLNELKDSKIFLVSDEEWNIIYLPELTQNSNVQDIIYEVNSNKPGGVNNPIKVNNKTVPKKNIRTTKPNDTTKILINMEKAQVGATDTFKFSPNLKSINGLKNKISQMNKEEKKNNCEKAIISNTKIKRRSINADNANSIRNGNGAIFEVYKEKVSQILSNLEKNLPQYKLNGFRNIWIMKPSNLSRGRGVTCVDSLQPIEQSLSATNDSGLIVQKYIENPLIISNRKFDIRQWVLVTCLNPLVIWMWKEPYVRFGAEDYKMDDLNNIYSHLTNNSIAKHSKQFKNETKFEGDMWTCNDFKKFLGEERWKTLHENIRNAIVCSFYSVHHEIKQRENSHELYGYDFMVDEDFNVYLIEVNASPALDYSTKITENAVKNMVKDLIEVVIDNNNARNCRVNEKGEIINSNGETTNKFIQIFNGNKDRIKVPDNVPNKELFY